MISVSNVWKNAQNFPIRPECDVKITNGSDFTLTKKDLNKFSMTQNGSIINKVFPAIELYLEIFNDRIPYEYSVDNFLYVYFGYYLPSSPNADDNGWEWINYGKLLLSKKEKPENGYITKYYLNNFFTSKQLGSGINHINDKYVNGSKDTTLMSLSSLGYRLGLNLEYTGVYALTINRGMKACEYKDALLSLAVACGKTLKPTPTDTARNFQLVDLLNTSVQDYIISRNNEFKYPEAIEEDKVGKYIVNAYTENASESGTERVTGFGVTTYHNVYAKVETGKFAFVDEVEGDGTASFSGNTISFQTSSTTPINITAYLELYSDTYSGVEFTVNSTGDDITIDSNIITSEIAQYCGNYLKNCSLETNKLETECRIDPRVELFDKIVVETKSGNREDGVVVGINLEFNGGFSGKITTQKLQSRYLIEYQEDVLNKVFKTEYLVKNSTPTMPNLPTIDEIYHLYYSSISFNSWDKSPTSVTSNQKYIAQYNKTIAKFENSYPDNPAGYVLIGAYDDGSSDSVVLLDGLSKYGISKYKSQDGKLIFTKGISNSYEKCLFKIIKTTSSERSQLKIQCVATGLYLAIGENNEPIFNSTGALFRVFGFGIGSKNYDSITEDVDINSRHLYYDSNGFFFGINQSTAKYSVIWKDKTN